MNEVTEQELEDIEALFVQTAASTTSDGDKLTPPNAVLSFAEPSDRAPVDAVVVIQDPHIDGDKLSYSITALPSSSTNVA